MRRLAFRVKLADGSFAVVAVPRLNLHQAIVLQEFPSNQEWAASDYCQRVNELAETFMPPKRKRGGA
jgi:hypothetical protein